MNYARIALSLIPRGRPGELPDRERTRQVAIDRDDLAAYDRVCGFRLRDELPATYPHVLAFPLAVELLSAPDFPLPPLGIVHVANRIEVLRPLTAHERLDLRVRAANLARHERGTTVDLIAEASVAGEPVWRGRSTYLRPRGGTTGRRPPGDASPREADAIWTVPADTGRRYARVSGDRNPIHLHPLTARLFGQPAAIAHGMWTKARCLAALEGSLPPAYTVDVRFKRPLRLPSRVVFIRGEDTFGVLDARTGQPHLTGTIAG